MKLPKMAAALLAAVLAANAALPALAADRPAELESAVSVCCTGEAADETLTVRLTPLEQAPMPEGWEEEARLEFGARDCRQAEGHTLTRTFGAITYTVPGVYWYTVTQDAGSRSRARYDDRVFRLKVTVAWDAEGLLRATQAVRQEGEEEKSELLFRNSYPGTDPLPPAVTPPAVTDKPKPAPAAPVVSPAPAASAQPAQPAQPAQTAPAALPEPVTVLLQTGQRLWPVPVLGGCGLGLMAVSLWLRRRKKRDA